MDRGYRFNFVYIVFVDTEFIMTIRIKGMENDQDVKHFNKTIMTTRPNYSNESQFEQVSELKEVFDNLDKDVVEDDHFTSIDFNTRLTDFELSSIVALQMLVPLRIGGKYCSLISRNIKRHKVSLAGLGRSEKVKIVQGQREHESEKQSMAGKIAGLFGSKSNENK